MYVVNYFNAAAWGGSGNVMLVAVNVNDNVNNAAFTYYCAVSGSNISLEILKIKDETLLITPL